MKKLITILFLFACSFAYAQSLPNVAFPTSEAVADTYTVNITNYGSSYNDKVALINFRTANSGPATLNITPSGGSALGARPLRKFDGSDWVPLASGDLRGDSSLYLVHYSSNCGCLRIVPQGTGSASIPDLDQVLTQGSTATIASPFTVTTTSGGFNIQNNESGVTSSVIGTTVETTLEWDNGVNYGNLTMDVNGNRFTGSETFSFAPTATESGLNAGSLAGDPSSPENGDLWYDQTANELTARINGANVALGAGGGGDIEIGTTNVTGGTNTRVLYNNSGVAGEYAISGTGSVAMTNSPTFTTPNIGTATGNITGNAATVTTNANLTGHITSTGNATTLGSFSSGNLSSAITDEVGTGSAVFSEPDVNTQTGSYTLVLSDKSKEVRMDVAGSNNLTVPLNATVAFPIGTLINISQYGAGTTTVVATGGVTIRSSAGNLLSPGQYSPMMLRKIATDEWYLWNGAAAVTAAFTRTNGTYITTTLSGSMSGALNTAVDITVDLTGVVPLTLGGTGASSSTQTYTPTLTNSANLSASTARQCTYMRVGNTITVAGQVDIDPTTTATLTTLGISLPVASNFTTAFQAGGSANAIGVADAGAGIQSDATNDRVTLQYVCTDVTNHTMTFTFTYQVL